MFDYRDWRAALLGVKVVYKRGGDHYRSYNASILYSFFGAPILKNKHVEEDVWSVPFYYTRQMLWRFEECPMCQVIVKRSQRSS